MKKRNIIAVLAALGAALMLFAACGDNSDGEPEVSTVIGADGQVYEEVTEIQSEIVTEVVTEIVTEIVTDKSGEAITNSKGETEVISEVVSEIKSEVVTSVVTVTKPYSDSTTTEKAAETTASQTTASGSTDTTEEATTTYEDVTFPEGTLIEVPMDPSTNTPKEPLMNKVMSASQDSRQFYLNCTIVTGETLGLETGMPVKMYLKNNNMAFEFTVGLMKVNMIMADNKFYMLFPSAKAYYEVSSSDSSDVGNIDTDLWGSLGSPTMDYVSTSRVKIKGTTYTCEEYSDSGNTNKYYFNSKEELKRIEIIASDGSVTILKISDCGSSVKDSVFTVPKGYTKLSEESLSALLGSLS